MLQTPVCDLLGMKVPIMQAAIWPATSPKLVAAVSEAGGLGSIGSVFESADSVQGQMARVREITPRPFVVNHVVPLLDEAAFQATLDAEPAVVSFALGDPGELVERAHGAGAKVIHQVHTVGQARKAAELGVDVIIAQGSEAGGQGMAPGVGPWRSYPRLPMRWIPSLCWQRAGWRTDAGSLRRWCCAPREPTWGRVSLLPRRPRPRRDGSGRYSRPSPRT